MPWCRSSRGAKVENWEMGNRLPAAAQNPYFNMSAFAYPDAYTTGSLGAYVLQAPGIMWNECCATKSWTIKNAPSSLSGWTGATCRGKSEPRSAHYDPTT